MDSSIQNYFGSVDKKINEIESMIYSTRNDIVNIDNIVYEKSVSTLNTEDLIMIISAGFIGGVFSSAKIIEDIFNNIHKGAHNRNSKGFFENILQHAGDEIDKGGNYIDRSGNKCWLAFHRLLFGHDLLSIHDDNPLFIMIKQHRVLVGMMQLLRHLVADTFSKQGLPLPGHSFLDYVRSDGKMGNYLINITEILNEGSDIGNIEAFNHLFTIRMQDILSQGLTWGIITSYIKVRGIEDKIRISQLKFSSYALSFLVNAVSGMIRTGGLPYINWTTFSVMVKEGITFFKLNYQEIKQLEMKTNEIVNRNIELEKKVFETGANIKTFNSADEYFQHIQKEKSAFDDLTNFFEGV